MKIFRLLLKVFLFSLTMLCITSAVSPVFASLEEDKKFLLMYFTEEELVVETPTRSPKPIFQVAENVTVVTAQDIKLMNAHTVADVLNTVTGVQVWITGGPGSIGEVFIQSSEMRHVAVFLDGIPLNNLSDNMTDVGSLPVENIERIEIIKGPASSTWGSSLGGVVNIITKTGTQDGPHALVSASYGLRNTGDFRAETSGKDKGFGYYVNAGRLQTNGFRPHNDFSGENAYTKLTYDFSKNTSALFTFGYNTLSRGEVEYPDRDYFRTNKVEILNSTLALNSLLNKETTVNFSLWGLRQTFNFFYYQLSSGVPLPDREQDYEDKGYGSSAKLTWKHESQNVVLGADYDTKTLESNKIVGGDHKLTKWALFLNDTMSFGQMSITPGIRNDHTNTNGDFTSPSLGMTYKIADSTLLRAYAARGFNIPPLGATYGYNIFYAPNPDLKMEKIWSYQLGAETTALKYLWIKGSAFRHDIKDVLAPEILSPTLFKWVNRDRDRRQGVDVEMKTAPIFHTALTAGAVFISAKNLDTGETIPQVPLRTYDVGLQYDDEKSFKALLKGHYIYWNMDPSFQGKYDSFIFDLHIIKNLYMHGTKTLEAFIDIHNILNGSQYPMAGDKNPGRWVEAGIRYAF